MLAVTNTEEECVRVVGVCGCYMNTSNAFIYRHVAGRWPPVANHLAFTRPARPSMPLISKSLSPAYYFTNYKFVIQAYSLLNNSSGLTASRRRRRVPNTVAYGLPLKQPTNQREIAAG